MHAKTIQIFYFLEQSIARLGKEERILEPKEFFINGEWQYNYELNIMLNDSIMDYGDGSVFDYKEINEEQALQFINEHCLKK